jgi:uncharacterized protein YecE (DUF72 family)
LSYHKEGAPVHLIINDLQLSFFMEFGRITVEELESVDFALPPDPGETTAILQKTKKKGKTQIWVGCAKWGRKDWVGKIYPPKTKEADFLSHYSRHFKCIEMNATFYKMPTKAQAETWSSKVGEDFLFCPKFSQGITHIRRLKNAKEATERFLDGISGFGKKLGPIFLMPHPGMGPKTLETIGLFLEELPGDIDLFLELRHADWFTDNNAFSALCKTMEKRKTGMIITDASGRRDCVHMRLTTPDAFIRFVGNGLHPTDYTRIDAWVERIKQWQDQNIKRVFFFMHQHEELHSPTLAKYLINKLNEECNASIGDIKFI